MNLIKQVVKEGQYGTQTIKMIVKDNERGPQGEKGDTGDSATITAGQAYSLPTEQQPAVMNVGTATNAVFDFYIPKGERGLQGPKGDDGAIQYTAGPGIKIQGNVISVVGGGGGGGDGVWGDIIGDIEDQTDLQQEFAQYTPTSDLAAVALSGSYDDLTNKPSVVNADWNATSGPAEILNKPTIPTVNDATLTVQQNGVNVATFTANSATNATANITSPVITMTTTDPGEGSALTANNYVGVYGGNPVILDYSTSEINTGTTWINGAPIYKKTVYTGTLPNATTKNVAHGISNLGLVIDIEGCAWDGSSTWLPIPNAGSSSAVIEAYVYSSNIVISTGMDRSGFTTSYVTLYYTKSS
jgi:hypothetical protein